MSRNIEDLREWFQPKVRSFIYRAKKAGLPVKITRTYTSDLTQRALYAIGRRPLTAMESANLTAEGLYPDSFEKIRTKAKNASKTSHGMRLAFDCIPWKDGKPWWKAPKWVWDKLYKIAEDCGLDAMGDEWGEYLAWDKGHFSEPGWKLYRKKDGKC